MEKTEKKKYEKLLEFCVYVLVVVALSYFVLTTIAQRSSVNGSSMYPTLEDGDQIIVEKLSYRFHEPKRNDIIVFRYENPEREEMSHFIKRIIGLPGETIQITGGTIFIDGEELEDPYGYYSDGLPMLGYDAEFSFTIDENEYFVLGDNRNDSLDSRKIGCISKKDIIGRACLRMYPFHAIGKID